MIASKRNITLRDLKLEKAPISQCEFRPRVGRKGIGANKRSNGAGCNLRSRVRMSSDIAGVAAVNDQSVRRSS